jgi:hypothetical protein
MKYFEKVAFDPKRLIGPTVGATSFGLTGYAGAEPGKEWQSAAGSALMGGVVGAGVQAWMRKLKDTTKTLKSIMSEQGGGGSTEAILQKSREAMEALEKQEAKIKSHVTAKSEFKYTDALKMTKEKRASFLDIVTGKKIKQLGKLTKRYEKALKHHSSKIDQARETRNVTEALTAANNSMRALKKLDELNFKTGIEQLKRIGVLGGAAVGVSAGAGAIAGRNKKAAFFEKTEKDLTNKELQKELRRGYFAGGLSQTAGGGVMGAYIQSFLGKVGKRPVKGLALGAAAGLALTPVSNILDKKDILKEVDRRKKHPGYK